MSWVRRVLTDTEDDGRYRSALAAILGASIATLTLVFGLVDVEPFVISTFTGFIVAAPLWRFVGEPLNRPLAVITFIAFLIASVIVVRVLPRWAFFPFLGGWAFTLGVLRYKNGWRNPVPIPTRSDVDRGPIRPILVLALVVPLLALLAVIVIGVSVERGLR